MFTRAPARRVAVHRASGHGRLRLDGLHALPARYGGNDGVRSRRPASSRDSERHRLVRSHRHQKQHAGECTVRRHEAGQRRKIRGGVCGAVLRLISVVQNILMGHGWRHERKLLPRHGGMQAHDLTDLLLAWRLDVASATAGATAASAAAPPPTTERLAPGALCGPRLRWTGHS